MTRQELEYLINGSDYSSKLLNKAYKEFKKDTLKSFADIIDMYCQVSLTGSNADVVIIKYQSGKFIRNYEIKYI